MAKLTIFKKHTVFDLLLLATILKFENLTCTVPLSTQLDLILAILYFMRLNIFEINQHNGQKFLAEFGRAKIETFFQNSARTKLDASIYNLKVV